MIRHMTYDAMHVHGCTSKSRTKELWNFAPESEFSPFYHFQNVIGRCFLLYTKRNKIISNYQKLSKKFSDTKNNDMEDEDFILIILIVVAHVAHLLMLITNFIHMKPELIGDPILLYLPSSILQKTNKLETILR